MVLLQNPLEFTQVREREREEKMIEGIERTIVTIVSTIGYRHC